MSLHPQTLSPPVRFLPARPPNWRRWSLWPLLVVLVATMLITLVWLAGRYEASQVQGRIERDVADAVADVRAGLTRNLQSLQALQASGADMVERQAVAALLLREHREFLRIEWRDAALNLRGEVNTPYRSRPFSSETGRDPAPSDLQLTCAAARRTNGPSYSQTYFLPRSDGLGIEVIELCVPQLSNGRVAGYMVARYGLQEILVDLVGKQITRHQDISFTEADGTRLAALHGSVRRGTRMFSAQQLVDLPGSTLVLRMDSWHGAPSVFPNVLTALVTFMSIALIWVLVLLSKDNRRRLQAENDLADALAFRKAMEDSLVTGLRARDLQGRITYVNPAFCDMVGFGADELLGRSGELPYWPPEKAEEYARRHAVRIAGELPLPPREGYESVYMRKGGDRFPVLIIEAPLINAQGQHTGWMGAFLDMSEQRRIEELSRASQERLQATARLATVGEMASLLSHELNQPLAAISSYATGSLNLLQDLASAGLPAGAAQAAGRVGRMPVADAAHTAADIATAMHRIAEQAERAGRVIRSVHDFVRRRDQAREATDTRVLIDAVMPLIRLQAQKLGVQVHTSVAPGLPRVYCDRTMVEQVLLNLARNGMQAMDQPGQQTRRLEISVRRADADSRGEWLEFSVADRGAGIAADVAAQLFTPFFTTKQEGMGLGLSLCRTVVEQHGGALTYASHLPHGTVFSFTLPAEKRGTAHGA